MRERRERGEINSAWDWTTIYSVDSETYIERGKRGEREG